MPAKKSTTAKKSTASAKTTKETFQVNGNQVVSKVRELVREGNVRKITIQNKAGKNLLVIPVTLGVVATLIAPYLVVLGGLAVMLTECRITVERE